MLFLPKGLSIVNRDIRRQTKSLMPLLAFLHIIRPLSEIIVSLALF